MTTSSDLPDPPPPAPSSPYPTVQILQAAMAHRDAIRRSFESQRATLAEAIAAQKQAVTQAVVNTQGRGVSRQGEKSAPAVESAAGASAAHAADGAPLDRLPSGANPAERLVIALSLLMAPGFAAQSAMALQQFLDALQLLIAEEVARQMAQDRGDAGKPGAAHENPAERADGGAPCSGA